MQNALVDLVCTNCLAPLDITQVQNGVIACKYCGKNYQLPQQINSAVPRFRVGSHVRARWTNNHYYGAVLIQYENGRYLAKWDDGDAPLWVAESDIVADLAGTDPSLLQVGMQVRARWKDGNHYRCVLTQKQGEQYLATWCDGDAPMWVTPNDIILEASVVNAPPAAGQSGVTNTSLRVGMHVKARWTNGHYYKCVLTQQQGNLFLCTWDDGDTPLWVESQYIQLV